MTELMDALEPRDWLLAGALAIGLAFGLVARLSGFCFRSALLELAGKRPGRQVAAWIGALAVAILGTQTLALAGVIDLAGSVYLSDTVTLGALVLGGLLFGAGMMLTRGCGARHVVLAAGGNLRSWVVIVTLGLVGYATLRGMLAIPRVWIAQAATAQVTAPDQGVATLLAASLEVEPGVVAAAAMGALAVAAIVILARTAWGSRIAPWLAGGRRGYTTHPRGKSASCGYIRSPHGYLEKGPHRS